MSETGYSRHIGFESLFNFRDLGGYSNNNGKITAWRRIFRSGEFNRITGNDFTRLRDEIGLKTVIDLRSELEINRQPAGLMTGAGFKYFNIPLIANGGDRQADEERFRKFTNMGQVYLEFVHQKGYIERIVRVLEIIAAEDNHPLVFHCAVGKDRTGMIAAFLLNVLDVPERVIIEDYALSHEPMKVIRKSMEQGPLPPAGERLPDYFWEATPPSMTFFLSELKSEYGSIRECLKNRGGG